MRGVFLFFLFVPCVAHAVCNPGDYLADGECKRCISGYYCPGDDTMIKCPEDTTDWASEYTQKGYTVSDVRKEIIWSVTYNPAGKISDCHSGVYITVAGGQFYIEPPHNGTQYRTDAAKLWYSAAPGYYLSSYRSTTWYPWYHAVKPCTNLPDNAHYTGYGTPDAPDGSIIDANDCPWECNDGYGRHNDECLPLCDAGVTHLHFRDMALPLFPRAYSSPTLAIGINNQVCYGVLVPGRAQNTINISYDSMIYHVEN